MNTIKKIDSSLIKKSSKRPTMKKKKLNIKQEKPLMTSERNNEKFISILAQLEDYSNRQGKPFQSKAYKKAQELIMEITEDLKSVEQLDNIDGIGSSIKNKFKEFLETGTLKTLEEEKNNPINILTNVYGIGPQKAKDLIKDNINTIEDLEKNKNKLNDKQLIGLKYYYDLLERIPRSEIIEYQKIFTEIFEEVKINDDAKFEIVGSFRRGAETSGDIDIIINDKTTFDAFVKSLIDKNVLIELLTDGVTKKLTIARLNKESKPRRIDFLYSAPDEYAFAVLYFTGSKTFNVFMRSIAKQLNLTLNEHGLSEFKDKVKGKKIDKLFPDEESIFNHLNMEYKKPEERIGSKLVVHPFTMC